MAIEKNLLDCLLADYKKPEDLIGETGLLKQLTKALLCYVAPRAGAWIEPAIGPSEPEGE